MKYIDADKLIAGIKHLQEKFPVATYDALYHLIASLQQEQPEVELEKEVKRWKNKYGVVGMDDLWLNFARHFYELGQRTKYQQDRAEFAKLKAKEWQSGYDKGYAKGINAKKEE